MCPNACGMEALNTAHPNIDIYVYCASWNLQLLRKIILNWKIPHEIKCVHTLSTLDVQYVVRPLYNITHGSSFIDSLLL